MSNPGIAGLVSWWSMSESSGTRYDSKGFNNLTSINGVGSWGSGKPTPSARFIPASSQYLTISDNNSLSIGTFNGSPKAFTIAFWTYLASVPTASRFITKWIDGGSDREYQIVHNSGSVVFYTNDGTSNHSLSATTFGALSNGPWYHIVATYDPSTGVANIYINTVNDTTNWGTGIQNTLSTAPFSIGYGQGAPVTFDGLIDEVSLWTDRVLTSTEISWLYNSGAGRAFSEVSIETDPTKDQLISWWELEEASGTRYDSRGSNHLDQVVGSPGRSSAIQGYGVDLESTLTQDVGIASNASLQAGDIDITIGCWVKVESFQNNQRIISKRTDNSNYDYDIFLSGTTGRLYFMMGSGSGGAVNAFTPDYPITVGEWHFILVWHDASASRSYIQIDNGPIIHDYGDVTTPVVSSAKFRIGNLDQIDRCFDGIVDEAFLYKKVLSEEERNYLYNHGAGRAFSEIADVVYPLTANSISVTPDVDDGTVEVVHTPIKTYPYIGQPPAGDTPVYIIDPSNLKMTGIIEDYFSLIWTERYNELGEFELDLPLEYVSNPLVTFGMFLYIRSSKRLMIIEDLKPSTTEEKSSLLVKGRSAESLLIRRVLQFSFHVNDYAESIAYSLMSMNFTNASNTKRNMSILKTTFPTPSIDVIFEDKLLLEPILNIIEKICVYGSLGYIFELENNKLAFSLYEGVDRSVGQSENNYVIFSDNFDNVVSSSFYESQKDRVNIVLVSTTLTNQYGEEENSSALGKVYVWEDTEPSGLDRYETVLETAIKRTEKTISRPEPEPPPDPSDYPVMGISGYDVLACEGISVTPELKVNWSLPEEVETPLSDAEVAGIITTRGQEVLDNNRLVGYFEGDFDIEGNFKYGIDFYMGDVVQCVLENKNVAARIVELVRSYSTDGVKIYVAFDFI